MQIENAAPVCLLQPRIDVVSLDEAATARRWMWRAIRAILVGAAVVGADKVHAQLPWVPVPYLASLLVLPMIGWRLLRWRSGPGVLRWSSLGVVAAALGALMPVPWMTANLNEPPGTAWRLDGRLTIDGNVIDPSGSWYWLTVGRPPLVAELVYGWLFDAPGARDLRDGSTGSRPEFNEPAAAAVGLRRAGRPIEFALTVDASSPTYSDLPERLVVARLNGIPIESRDHWSNALETLGRRNALTARNGDVYWFDGHLFPYRRVDMFDVPVDTVDASVGGALANVPPIRWWRGLSLGSSHGLMVALLAYTYESGVDLGRGRPIAGTGGIRGDGSVSPIGGLRAKATAARNVGAEILLFPAEQASTLSDFDPGTMRLVPVSSLDEAIAALRAGS